jgi:hypothetical protein
LVLWFSPVSQTYVSAIHILRAVHLFQQKAIIAAKHLPPAQQLRQLGEVRRHAAGLEARASTRWSAPLTNCRKSMRRTIG